MRSDRASRRRAFSRASCRPRRDKTTPRLRRSCALTSDFPELPEPYNNLAVLYAKKGEYEGARVALETAVQAAPDWAVAHENLGDVYVRIAAGEYERAAKLDKENKSAGAKLVLARNILAPAPKPVTATTPTPTTTQAPAK